MFQTFPTQMRERLAGTAIRTITQPLLVLSLGFGLPALGIAAFLSGAAQLVDLGLAAFFPILFGITHVYFMFREPDRLQSEDWRLQDRSLALMETAGGVVRDPDLLKLSSSDSVTAKALPTARNDNEANRIASDAK